MLTSWFGAQPAGSRASIDDGNKSDVDDDTQIMEPDQGNGKSPGSFQAIPTKLVFSVN